MHGSGAQYDPDCDPVAGGKYGLRSYLGDMIDFEQLPPDCQTVVLRDLQHITEGEDK
jgi:hypothetical protein